MAQGAARFLVTIHQSAGVAMAKQMPGGRQTGWACADDDNGFAGWRATDGGRFVRNWLATFVSERETFGLETQGSIRD